MQQQMQKIPSGKNLAPQHDLEAALALWMEVLNKEASWRMIAYPGSVRRFMRYIIANQIDIKTLKEQDIANYFLVNYRTINKRMGHVALRHFFDFLIENGLMTTNPIGEDFHSPHHQFKVAKGKKLNDKLTVTSSATPEPVLESILSRLDFMDKKLQEIIVMISAQSPRPTGTPVRTEDPEAAYFAKVDPAVAARTQWILTQLREHGISTLEDLTLKMFLAWMKAQARTMSMTELMSVYEDLHHYLLAVMPTHPLTRMTKQTVLSAFL